MFAVRSACRGLPRLARPLAGFPPGWSGPAAEVRAAVVSLADQHGASSTSTLDDLAIKFAVRCRRWPPLAAACPAPRAPRALTERRGGPRFLLEQVLTACEREFERAMPHTALNAILTVDDAARYWEGRLEEETAAAAADAKHWTKAHPPNVFADIAGPGEGPAQLNEWLARNGTDPRDVPYRGQELAVDPEVEHELSSFKMGQKV